MQDVYYGSANRNRGRYDPRQYIWKSPLAPTEPGKYTSPLMTFNPSVNGIEEYRATTFGGKLKGHLLLLKWNGPLYDVELSADGR